MNPKIRIDNRILQFIVLIATAVGAFSLIGCSKKKSSQEYYYDTYPGVDYYNHNTYTPSNVSALQQEFNDLRLSCSRSDCPNNVALLLLDLTHPYYGRQSGRCTGFLVADDMIATNAHCIPDSIRYEGASCAGKILVGTLDHGKKKSFNCNSVVKLSTKTDETKNGPDYAILKIDSTNTTPFKLERQPITDGTEVQVWRATRSEFEESYTISRDTCRTVLKSILNQRATNPFTDTGLAVGCQVVHGNSGSPVLNSNGAAIGIIQAYNDIKNREGSSSIFGNLFGGSATDILNLPPTIPDHGIFTNFACFTDYSLPILIGGFRDERCDNYIKQKVPQCSENSLYLGFKEVRKELYANWQSKLPTIFGYNFNTNDKSADFFNSDAVCVKTERQLAEYGKYVKRGLFGSQSIDVLVSNMYVANYELAYDQSLRLMPKPIEPSSESITRVTLKKSGNMWVGRAKTAESTFSPLADIDREFNIPSCSDEMLKEPRPDSIGVFLAPDQPPVKKDEIYQLFVEGRFDPKPNSVSCDIIRERLEKHQ